MLLKKKKRKITKSIIVVANELFLKYNWAYLPKCWHVINLACVWAHASAITPDSLAGLNTHLIISKLN